MREQARERAAMLDGADALSRACDLVEALAAP
jgi:hypothetical protein